MSAVAVDRLTKRFGDFAAVDGVSFEVPTGQLVAVLGPNGAGKTTTLEMLDGFQAPTSGTARVFGVDPHRGDRRWRAGVFGTISGPHWLVTLASYLPTCPPSPSLTPAQLPSGIPPATPGSPAVTSPCSRAGPSPESQ